jgi:hypothetical protein
VREHRHDLVDERGLSGAGTIQKRLLLRRGKIGGLMKQPLHAFPPGTIHAGLASQVERVWTICVASHALAARQSRRMVASDTSSSAAVSVTSSPPK